MIFENLSTCFANISVMNFQKSKIWDVHFLRFFMLIAMRWFWFAISYCFWLKNGLENGPFSYFSKFHDFWKSLNLFCKYLCDKFSKIKNLICTFSSFFHADCHEIILICKGLVCPTARFAHCGAINSKM